MCLQFLATVVLPRAVLLTKLSGWLLFALRYSYYLWLLEVKLFTYRSMVQDASAYWNQQPLAAREYAARTIIPACTSVADISTSAKDLIEKELSAFYQSLDNSLFMLPSTPQVVNSLVLLF